MRAQQRVGEYTLVTRIGAGGMGETWLAARPGLDKKVVIKMILPELAAIPQVSQYFSAEGKLGARLHHSNIVNLIDRGSGYIVLEYVEGIDLERLLGTHRTLPAEWAVYIGSHLCKALSYVNSARIDGQPGDIVHRDVTPDNVFLSCAGEVKLGDFGIAQVKAVLRERTRIPGQIKGKYKYLSPEMARGEPVDLRADIFQIGLVVYEMVTGTAAFSGTRAATESIKRGIYRPISELTPDVPPALVKVIEHLMASDPDDRPESAALAGELMEDACPTFYRASRQLGEAVLKLADLRASTTFSVPDHMRAMLTAATAKDLPQPLPKVIVEAMPEDSTLIPDGPPARPFTRVLTDGVPEAILPERTPVERKFVTPRAVVHVAPSERRWTPPNVPTAKRRSHEAWILASGVLAMAIGVGGGVFGFLSFRAKSAAPAKPSSTNLATPIALSPPAAPPPAPALQGVQETTRKRAKEPSDSADLHHVALILVREEAEPRVVIDGASFSPPVRYPAEPGPHKVEIIRGEPPNEQRTQTTVNVRPGDRQYTVNSSPPSPSRAVSTELSARSTQSFDQAVTEAREELLGGMYHLARASAREAVKRARNDRQRQVAYCLVATTSCHLHDAPSVAEALDHLDDEGHRFVERACGRDQMEIRK